MSKGKGIRKRICAFTVVLALVLSVTPWLRPETVAFAETAYSGYCGAQGNETNVSWSYDPSTKKLTIDGTGAMVGRTDDAWASFKDEIETVAFGDGITSIGDQAFMGCASLQTITGDGAGTVTKYEVSGSIEHVGWRAFWDTPWILQQTASSTDCLYVGKVLVRGATGTVTVKKKTVEIADEAFRDGTDYSKYTRWIKRIYLDQKLRRIGKWAFRNCKKLSIVGYDDAGAITRYIKLETIDESAFAYCTTLETVDFLSYGSDSNHNAAHYGAPLLKTIGAEAFKNCKELKPTQKIATVGVDNNKTRAVAFPDSVEFVGRWALQNTGWLKHLIIPGNQDFGDPDVVYVGKVAYMSKINSTDVTIKDGTVAIGRSAFSKSGWDENVTYYGHDNKLTTIKLPRSLKRIETSAFDGCENLKTVYLTSPEPPELEPGAFNASNNYKFYVNGGAYGRTGMHDWGNLVYMGTVTANEGTLVETPATADARVTLYGKDYILEGNEVKVRASAATGKCIVTAAGGDQVVGIIDSAGNASENGAYHEWNGFKMPAGDAMVSLYNESDYFGAGNDGSDNHPYTIRTAKELGVLAARVNAGENFSGKKIVLANDISFKPTAATNFTPIGFGGKVFKGTFDGQGHKISGICIHQANGENLGLFGNVQGGTIRNVTISGAEIIGNVTVGGIVGNVGAGSTLDNMK